MDPRVGGRVTSLERRGVEILSGASTDPANYGSTFWTSPQADWGWPPPAAIDRSPYAAEASGDAIVLTGAPHTALGVRVTKRFSVDAGRGAFVIEYGIHNVGTTPRSCAPWEVTRVPARGLTFFAACGAASGSLRLDERDGGATWYDHDPAPLPVDGLKAFASGRRGWLAHVAAGLVYAKRFDQVPEGAQAPGESEIEIYANPRYVELEVQGRYARIDPGDRLSWTVRWFVRDLPAGMAATVGNADLVAFVDGLVG